MKNKICPGCLEPENYRRDVRLLNSRDNANYPYCRRCLQVSVTTAARDYVSIEELDAARERSKR